MPEHMYNLTVAALERLGKKMKGSKVAMLGWAFIRDSDDARNTPSEPYRDFCLKAGAGRGCKRCGCCNRACRAQCIL